jgi:hypothetical protein
MELKPPTINDIACHFFASRISGATIPATRLSNILENMYRGRPLTPLALGYLKQHNFHDLHELAIGKISYQAYIATIDPTLVALEQTAQVELQANEAARLAQKAKWAITRQRRDEALDATRTAHFARNAERTAQHQREREAAEITRISREADWVTQGAHNREIAEAAFNARLSGPDYKAASPDEIARHFRVDNNPTAVTRPLSNILEALYQGRPLAATYINYLKIKRFSRLYELACGQITFESYISNMDAVEAAHAAADIARREPAEQQRLRREAAEIARIARESDPAYIALKLREAKCQKYGILNFNQLPESLIPLLEKLDADVALSADEYLWLTTTGKHYFTFEVRRGYHRGQALQCASEYLRTQDPWHVVNGSGHYRKCDMPNDALQLLDQANIARITCSKLKSAAFTTRGGVMRDLHKRDDAVNLGVQAHELTPKDFRPCTLLGAVYMELGDYNLARDWYDKAIKRGATEQGIDSEIKRIFAQADKVKRASIRTFLLADDPVRFAWVNQKNNRNE